MISEHQVTGYGNGYRGNNPPLQGLGRSPKDRYPKHGERQLCPCPASGSNQSYIAGDKNALQIESRWKCYSNRSVSYSTKE